MNDILNMATLGAACSDKRREDDLHGELNKLDEIMILALDSFLIVLLIHIIKLFDTKI